MHDPRVGRFFAVDPKVNSYPWYSSYQFSGNTPIMSVEQEGLQPHVLGGRLVGYVVQKGQGPTQIAADINDLEVQKRYGYILHEKIEWIDVVYDNNMQFATNSHVRNFENKNDKGYNSMNINKGDFLKINSSCGSLVKCEKEPKPKSITEKGLVLAPTKKIVSRWEQSIAIPGSSQTGDFSIQNTNDIEVWIEVVKINPKTTIAKFTTFKLLDSEQTGVSTYTSVRLYENIEYREINFLDKVNKAAKSIYENVDNEFGTSNVRIFKSWEEYDKATNGKGNLLEYKEKIDNDKPKNDG